MTITESGEERFDIVICGGSFVGLALARALIAMAPGAYSIAIIEQRPLPTAREGAFDGRSAAITASAKAMLEVLGVWPKLAASAEPIRRIELTDSALDAPIRPALIGLDASDAPGGQPTAYIVENSELRRALFAALEGAERLKWYAPDSIEAFTASEQQVSVRLASGAALNARLLAAADGQNSALRQMAGIRTNVWRSNKMGIVATVGIERPHQGAARQHFLPAGPFAILPMTGNRVSIVWTEEAEAAKRILAQGRETVLAELTQRFGPELGELTLLSEASAFPLTMTLAREFVRQRFVLVGDAAHGLHWIAGQGLNHGLKDVAALAETLIDASRLGLDIGDLSVLKRYERWRRFDSTTSAFAAAALNAMFSNDNMALRMLRSTGLRTADRFAGLKTFFMKEAAGLTGDLPKLLRGTPI
jgi:2-octaprenyl-6-methoxyphenol hydroxylase